MKFYKSVYATCNLLIPLKNKKIAMQVKKKIHIFFKEICFVEQKEAVITSAFCI